MFLAIIHIVIGSLMIITGTLLLRIFPMIMMIGILAGTLVCITGILCIMSCIDPTGCFKVFFSWLFSFITFIVLSVGILFHCAVLIS